MDLTSIIGVVGSFAVVVMGIMNGGDIGSFINIPSILIVIGGTIFAVVASYPFSILKNVVKHFPKLLKGKEFPVGETIDSLVDFAQVARKNGLLALETKAEELTDPFFKQGIMLVVDAMEADKVRELLENELANMDSRHQEEINLYEKAAGVAPAFGMIGTLVGLVNMLNNMSLEAGAQSSIGQDMAVALLTTLYGSLLGNVLFSPMAKKLGIRNEEECLYKQLIIEGVVGIQGGENPKILKEKLASLIHQKKRSKILESDGAAPSDDSSDKKKKK